MIKAIVFDCFGVFYVDPVFARMHDPHTSREVASELHELDEKAAEGGLSKQQFERSAGELLHETPEAAELEFFKAKGRDQALIDFTQQLRTQYKVGLLSNIGVGMIDGFFSPIEREKLFDAVVLSGEVGYTKPDPEIFELICDRLGVMPTEAVMIDDVEHNVVSAIQVGMHGIHYESITQLKAELAAILSSKD